MRGSSMALWAALTLVLVGGQVQGHSEIANTRPADGAVLAEAPEHIALTFDAPLRLTRVTVSHESNTPSILDLGDQTAFAPEFTIPLKETAPGRYRIEWRGLAEDGHAMQGGFTFEVE